MNLTRKIIVSLFLIFITLFKAQADSPRFSSLSQDDANKIAKEFSSNFVHTSLSPAGSLGAIFGFEVGVFAGATQTPELERVVKSVDATQEVDMIANAGVLGRVSVPYGITFELSLLPETTFSDITIKNTSYAIQYTPSFLSFLPVKIAAKLHGSSSKLSFNQTIGSDANGKVTIDSTTLGLQFLVSANLLLFEPYAGIGFVDSDTDILTTAQGGGTIFAFSSAESFNSKNDGIHMLVGTELNLLLFNIGVEYARVMDVSKYSAKLSLSF